MMLTVVSKVDSVVQFITVLFLFVLVLAATWFTTRYVAGVQKGKLKGSNFEVIDSFRISQTKYLQLIRIGDKYLAIAVCKDTVTVLTELSEDSVVFPADIGGDGSVQFEEFLKRAKSLVHKTEQKAADEHESDE